MPNSNRSIESFSAQVGADQLEDLRRRLVNARLPIDPGNSDWSYGVNCSYVSELVDYWIHQYDWSRFETAINRFSHYKTEIDGNPIHFIHQKGVGPRPLPIILSHGWPWTFWDFKDVIGPLSDPAAYGGDPEDAFDVVVPSMPGFGFSTPLAQQGINFWRTADLWHTLMQDILGYQRYAAQGGDWGALTTTQLGHKYGGALIGLHLTMVIPPWMFSHERPWDVTGGMMAPPDLSPAERERFLKAQRAVASHVAVQVLDPQTLSYGLHDSPVGLLAWLMERRRAWGDCRGDIESCFSKDFLITTTMLYWITESFVSSARFYAEAARHPWAPANDLQPIVQVPVGISHMLNDGTAGVSFDPKQIFSNIVFSRDHKKGGHFAPAEVPDAIVADIREMFRPLRD